MAKKKEEPKSFTINTTERVEVVATETHPYITEGEVYSCHQVVALKNIAQGYAVEKKGEEVPELS